MFDADHCALSFAGCAEAPLTLSDRNGLQYLLADFGILLDLVT
jgi:hypothetical protein